MNFSELSRVIEQLGKDRGIKKDVVVNAIEQAFLVTARKKFGIQGEYEARYNEADGEVEIFQYKNVVDKVRDSIVEIDFDAAKKLDEGCGTKYPIQIHLQKTTITHIPVLIFVQCCKNKLIIKQKMGLLKYLHNDLGLRLICYISFYKITLQ